MKLNLSFHAVSIVIIAITLNTSFGTLVAQALPKYEIVSLGGQTYTANTSRGAVMGVWMALKIDRGSKKVSICTTQLVNAIVGSGFSPVGCKVFQVFSGNPATSSFAATPQHAAPGAIPPSPYAFWSIDVTTGQVLFCSPFVGRIQDCTVVPDV